STRALDWASTRSPSTPTTTKSATTAMNAKSSFVRTVTGSRPTARTSGLSVRVNTAQRAVAWEASGTAVCVIDFSTAALSGSENRRRSCRADDQPLAVDLLHVLVGTDDRRDLAGRHVDVVTLEVQRAL